MSGGLRIAYGNLPLFRGKSILVLFRNSNININIYQYPKLHPVPFINPGITDQTYIHSNFRIYRKIKKKHLMNSLHINVPSRNVLHNKCRLQKIKEIKTINMKA